MKRFISLLVVLIFFGAPVQAGPIRIDMPSDRVDITLGFSGSELNVYGTYDAPGAVAVVVRGPKVNMTVRQKKPAMGVWLNADSITFVDVPSFYDYAAPLSLRSDNLLKANGIGLGAFDFETKRKRDQGERRDAFHQALLRQRQAQKLLPSQAKPLKIIHEGFFKANFKVPANAPTGFYDVSAYLFRDGALLGQANIDVRVAQVGFPASVHHFALDYALFYGLGTIALALCAGFVANAALRRD